MTRTRQATDDLWEKMEWWGCLSGLEQADKDQLRFDLDVVLMKCVEEVRQNIMDEFNKMEI